MIFRAKLFISDMHELAFFVAQLNKYDIAPQVHGRTITLKLEGENFELIQMVLSTYDSLKNKSGKNELSFTIDHP